MKQKVSKENEIGNRLSTVFSYYPRVWWAIVRKSLSKGFAYRFELASKFVRMVLIVILQLILIHSIYSSTDEIVGWQIDEYYLLVGIYNFVNYLSWGVFNVNLWRIEEKVLKGEFDFLLLYPSGSIFTASFIEFFLDDAIGSLSGLLLIFYYVAVNWTDITIVSVLGATIAIIASFVIWYAMHLTISAINFLNVKNGLMDLLKSVSRIGSFPVDIFSQSIRFTLYSLFPIAFIAAVPAKLLAGLYTFEFSILAVVVAVIMIITARKFWHFAIKNYTSNGG